MTWVPPARPAWVDAVNSGQIPPITDSARPPYDVDRLMAEARVRQGVPAPRSNDPGAFSDFGDDAFLEPFNIAVRALEDEAELTLLGRWMTRRYLVRLLEVRLQLAAYVASDPGVLDEQIVEPLFVVGAPRTGTTILHNLIAQDGRHRAPEGWELLRPVPPPLRDGFDRDARIDLADEELQLPQKVSSGLIAIHEYSGRMYKECLSSMSIAFRSEEFISRYHTPTYAQWLRNCDMRAAYETHKLVLQVLQRRMPTHRWVLKSPVHLHSLPTLLQVYPDARLAVTHRDPLTIMSSVTSLIATLRWAFSDRIDVEGLARYHADLYHGDLDRLVDATRSGALPTERVHHSQYTDFLADPLATVTALYQKFGWDLSQETIARMGAYVADHPQNRHGVHAYDFAGLGLDASTERERFSRYTQFFGVATA